MATIDDILGGGGYHPDGSTPPKGSAEWAEQHGGEEVGNAPKGSEMWAEQHSGDNAPVSSPASGNGSKITPVAQPETPKVKATTGSDPKIKTRPAADGGGYAALLDKLMPKPMTQEEIAKEEKKYKRQQIFNAIGEGIQALSNLFFTTQGAPNMYTGQNNSLDRTKARYDKMMNDNRDNALAYYNLYFRAKQADDAKADGERRWHRLLGLDQYQRDRDQAADKRYQTEWNYKVERDKAADQRYQDEQEYRRERDKKADDQWQQTFNQSKKQHEDDVETERGRNAATAARGVRGKRIGFADGDGNQVGIYENVWKGSMQQVFDAMISDLTPTDETERKRFEREMRKLDTPQKKEDYVKQNWHKSPKASQIMLTLSQLDPATMTSELNDEVVDYEPEEVIDYVPGNK